MHLDPDAARDPRQPGSPRVLGIARLAVLALAVAVCVGLVVMWPGDIEAQLEGLAGDTEAAEVETVQLSECPEGLPGSCGEAELRLESGPDEGSVVTVQLGGSGVAPRVDPGDTVRVAQAEGAPGAPAVYNLVDFERKASLAWLVLAFAVLVIAFGRLRGALSLLGLGLSLWLIVAFIVPAILDGGSPVVVATVGSLAVMLATIPLAHGLGVKSLAAILGTTVSLALVVGLAQGATELTHLTGVSSEEATLLNLRVTEVSFVGLLVAGMVVGALGVLDDVTVSQASTVLALRAAEPRQGFGELFGSAMRVGRDHVSATVNTLVLAYAGASLPVLLLFSSGSIGFVDVVNSEVVAAEIVAMLVGSIGLIAAVPVTTALAAVLAPHDPGSSSRRPHAH